MRIWILLATMIAFPVVAHAQPVNSGAPERSQSEEELITICKEMHAVLNDYYTRGEEIKDETQREKHWAENDPTAKYVARLTTFERANHGTHSGLMAVRQLVSLAAGGGPHEHPRDLGRRWALSVLPAYANSPVLPDIISRLLKGNGEPACEQFLRQLAKMPDISEQNRVFARYMLAAWALKIRDNREYCERRLREIADGSPEEYAREKEYLSESIEKSLLPEKIAELEREVIETLASLSKSSSGVRQPGVVGVGELRLIVHYDPEKTKQMPLVKELAAGLLFKERHLRIGSPAPELELQLVSGEKWSLAEQRGRAVVIQFSFKGCGACEAMYGDFRGLIDEYKGKLAIVSVMADEKREDTVDAVNSGKMTWDVHWDGAKGPLVTKWSVTYFPTVYVIGPDARVVAVDLRDEPLKAEIAKMMR